MNHHAASRTGDPARDLARCANPRCRRGGDPEPVYGKETVCEYCARRLERQLTDLAYAHDELETVLAAGSAVSARFDKVAGSRTPPVPVRLEVADHRDHIRHLLVSWVQLVIEERGMSRWPDDRPTAMAGYLASHLDWLARHPAAGDLCAEVSTALGRARGLLERPGAVCTLPCPDVYGEGCDGTVRVTAEATWVRCAECGWETDDLPWLGRLLRGSEPALVTAVDACHRLLVEGWQITPSTIRSWVRRGKVGVRGREGGHANGRRLYDLDELRARLQNVNRARAS